MASHDTTAITLTLMSYFLAKHPEWQDKVRAEIKTVNLVNDINIPKNTAVNAVFQMTHTDKDTWTNPLKFDPERFNKERKEQTKCPFSYAPFGAGPHHCIGYGFAVELLKQYQLSVPTDYECAIRDVPLKQPKDNLPMSIRPI